MSDAGLIKRILAGIKFLFSTIFDSVTGLPGGGRVSDAVMDKFASYFLNSSNVPPKWVTISAGNSIFLNYDNAFLIYQYSNEKPVAEILPYVEIFRFTCNNSTLHLKADTNVFQISPWDNETIDTAAFEAYRNFLADGHRSRNLNIIRVNGWTHIHNGIELHISKTNYDQQAKSNLLLDFQYESKSGELISLRKAFSSEFGGLFPPLNDKRLANTLGVATLVIYKENGIFFPFLVPRSRTTAVFNQTHSWHCTSSFAARWDDAQYGTDVFDSMIRKHQLLELQKEAGIKEDSIVSIKPLAFCREMLRGGKPQLFFVAFVNSTYKELLTNFETARQKVLKDGERVEVLRMPIFRNSKGVQDMKDFIKFFEAEELTAEAATALFYWSTMEFPTRLIW